MNKLIYSDYVHPKFGRALLLDPIYYMDHSLETAVKSPVEYNTNISIDDFSQAKLIGRINSVLCLKDVYRIVFDNNRIWYGLFEYNIEPTKLICSWDFSYDPDMPLIPVDSYCVKEHQNNGLLSELFWFIAKNEHHSISSPIVSTYDSAKFWNRLINDFYRRQIHIYHRPTNKSYTVYSAGKVIDGKYVIDPNEEKLSDYQWEDKTIRPKEWFYVLVAEIYKNSSDKRYLGMIQPYFMFGRGYE